MLNPHLSLDILSTIIHYWRDTSVVDGVRSIEEQNAEFVMNNNLIFSIIIREFFMLQKYIHKVLYNLTS